MPAAAATLPDVCVHVGVMPLVRMKQGPAEAGPCAERKREKQLALALVFARPTRSAGSRGLVLRHGLALGPALLP
jgi:hypothetical protein